MRFLVAVALLIALSSCGGDDRVTKFVHTRYMHGVPQAEAEALGIRSVDLLGKVLEDSSEMAGWPNAVEALGYLGGPKARDYLLKFFESRSRGVLSHDEFVARSLVPIALGRIASDGDEGAEKYLRKLCDVGSSPANGLGWKYNGFEGRGLTEFMAEQAVNGIAAGGDKDNIEFLEHLRSHALVAPRQRFLVDDINYALERLKGRIGIGNEGAAAYKGAPSYSSKGVLLCAGKNPPKALPARNHFFKVVNHVDVNLDLNSVKVILADASGRLVVNNMTCAVEVACPVTLNANAVEPFGVPSGKRQVIHTIDDLNAVLAIPGQFKVVNSILFCKEPKHAYGCTLRGSSVVESGAASDVWAHEFGHSRGLDDTHVCAGKIMDESSINTHAVSHNECVCFGKP